VPVRSGNVPVGGPSGGNKDKIVLAITKPSTGNRYNKQHAVSVCRAGYQRKRPIIDVKACELEFSEVFDSMMVRTSKVGGAALLSDETSLSLRLSPDYAGDCDDRL
jgi:hypothetical protein